MVTVVGSATFKERPDILKIGEHHVAIAGESCLRRGCQIRTNLRAVLMQREYSEDVAENHADENQRDTPKKKKAARAHGCKLGKICLLCRRDASQCLKSVHGTFAIMPIISALEPALT